MVSTVASQQEVQSIFLYASLHVLSMSAWVSSGCFPHSSKTCRRTGESKFPVGVTVSMNGCLSLYVSPVVNWQLVQGESRPCPMSAGFGSIPLRMNDELNGATTVKCCLHMYVLV